MPASIDSDESYLGQNFTVSQLLRVAKRKLQVTAFNGRFVQGLQADSYRSTETLTP